MFFRKRIETRVSLLEKTVDILVKRDTDRMMTEIVKMMEKDLEFIKGNKRKISKKGTKKNGK